MFWCPSDKVVLGRGVFPTLDGVVYSHLHIGGESVLNHIPEGSSHSCFVDGGHGITDHASSHLEFIISLGAGVTGDALRNQVVQIDLHVAEHCLHQLGDSASDAVGGCVADAREFDLVTAVDTDVLDLECPTQDGLE